MLAIAQRGRDRDADKRHSRNQQAGECARDALLSARQEEPRTGDLDRRKCDQRDPAAADLAQPSAREDKGHEDQRRNARPHEDEGRRSELAHRDADEEVGNSPQHAHRSEQQESAASHQPVNLLARRELPYSLVEERDRAWLDWPKDQRFLSRRSVGGDDMKSLRSVWKPLAVTMGALVALWQAPALPRRQSSKVKPTWCSRHPSPRTSRTSPPSRRTRPMPRTWWPGQTTRSICRGAPPQAAPSSPTLAFPASTSATMAAPARPSSRLRPAVTTRPASTAATFTPCPASPSWLASSGSPVLPRTAIPRSPSPWTGLRTTVPSPACAGWSPTRS